MAPDYSCSGTFDRKFGSLVDDQPGVIDLRVQLITFLFFKKKEFSFQSS